MKRIVFPTLLAIMATSGMMAATVEVDGLCYDLDDETSIATLVNKATYYEQTEITVPESVDNNSKSYYVVLGEGCFKYASNLVSVNLPTTITAIPKECFYQTALEAITLHEGITEIGDMAFYATNISEITFPTSLVEIGECNYDSHNGVYLGAFTNTKLTKVTIPGNVKKIGNCAFYYIDTLSEVTVEEGVEQIGPYAFRQNFALEKVSLPESLTKVGISSFSYNSVLTDINIPAHLDALPGGMLYRSYLYSDPLIVGEDVEFIGGIAFAETSIPSVVVGPNVKLFHAGPFRKITTLTAFSILDSNTPLQFEPYRGERLSNGTQVTDVVCNYFSLSPITDFYMGRDFQLNSNEHMVALIESFPEDYPEGFDNPFINLTTVQNLTLGRYVTKCDFIFGQNESLATITALGATPTELTFEPTDEQYATVKVTVPADAYDVYSQAPIWKNFANLKAAESGIGNVISDMTDGTVRYYDLRGYPVAKPVVGTVYIRTQNGHTDKVRL